VPKTAAKPTRASTKARNVEVEDDEEEEEIPARRAKTVTPTSKNGKVAAKPAPAKSKPAAKNDEGYNPNPNSQRAFIMRALHRGGTSADIKKRAARMAERANVEALSDPKAFKGFDVAYFAKFLKEKGYDVDIDVEADTYTLN